MASEILVFGLLSVAFLSLLLATPHTQPPGIERAFMSDVQGIPWGTFEFIPRLASDISGGLYGGYLIPAAVALWAAATKRWRMLALVAAVFALHWVLISPKLFVIAYRPSPVFGVEGAGGMESFPSGHVQWATSFYGLLTLAAWRTTRSQVRWFVVASYVLLVLGSMIGRMELGRHWPVDVVAGLLVGLIALRVLALLHSASFGSETARAQPG